MKRTCLIGILATSLMLLTTSGQVWSASITVLNPGFEDNVLNDVNQVLFRLLGMEVGLRGIPQPRNIRVKHRRGRMSQR